MIEIKTAREIELMRQSGRILAQVLTEMISKVSAGMTTEELAYIAEKRVYNLGAKPSFLNYNGFPAVVCISINDEVVHGLPGKRVIKPGDLVSIDFGVEYKGLLTDAARTVLVESDDPTKQKLIDVTKKSLEAGIKAVRDGCRVGDIGNAVQKVLEKPGYGVVRSLVGHGVGRKVHEEPDIPNYGNKGTGQIIQAGSTLAIEPMSTMGGYEVYTAADGWAIVTRDNSLSAHFEDTVVVTKNGAEVLTRL